MFSTTSNIPINAPDLIGEFRLNCLQSHVDLGKCDDLYSNLMDSCKSKQFKICEMTVMMARQAYCRVQKNAKVCETRGFKRGVIEPFIPNPFPGTIIWGPSPPPPPPPPPPTPSSTLSPTSAPTTSPTTSSTTPSTTPSTPSPTPVPTPPPAVQPSPVPPPPPPSRPDMTTIALIMGAGLFCIVYILASALGFGFFYLQNQEKMKEEESKKKAAELAKQSKGKRHKKKKKGKIIEKTVGEETKIEREEAKRKDRAEETHRIQVYEEAYQQENSFLDA